eukprot:TRINITY_DN24085_c0_g2_i1.p1 TRINITY_DN24085_c0_g2~~TRINITY_DN24085_c0_g2_i1.p1  ORF type:complete len:192 (-),score=34.94 TRINITY_DN24085_c0_g2_i1:196-771(-)
MCTLPPNMLLRRLLRPRDDLAKSCSEPYPALLHNLAHAGVHFEDADQKTDRFRDGGNVGTTIALPVISSESEAISIDCVNSPRMSFGCSEELPSQERQASHSGNDVCSASLKLQSSGPQWQRESESSSDEEDDDGYDMTKPFDVDADPVWYVEGRWGMTPWCNWERQKLLANSADRKRLQARSLATWKVSL